jgi:hypothetical protein
MLGSDAPLGKRFGDQMFANQLVTLMEYGEGLVLQQLQPEINLLMIALDALVERPEPLSPDALLKELDRLTTPINNAMERILPLVMVRLQGPLQDQASKIAPVTSTSAALTPEQLLTRAVVGGESVADHLRRRSPSRWQAELMGAIRAGIEAGWQRHRQAVEESINRLAGVMASSAMWAHGNRELEQSWKAPARWRYVGELDPSTCPICNPWINKTARDRTALPLTPQHFNCRCFVTPA